jgi:hypothetical protein
MGEGDTWSSLPYMYLQQTSTRTHTRTHTNHRTHCSCCGRDLCFCCMLISGNCASCSRVTIPFNMSLQAKVSAVPALKAPALQARRHRAALSRCSASNGNCNAVQNTFRVDTPQRTHGVPGVGRAASRWLLLLRRMRSTFALRNSFSALSR